MPAKSACIVSFFINRVLCCLGRLHYNLIFCKGFCLQQQKICPGICLSLTCCFPVQEPIGDFVNFYSLGKISAVQRRALMSKKKIADSIIIRVGGGIREVPRDSADIAARVKTVDPAPPAEKKEELHPLGTDLGANINDKIIN